MLRVCRSITALNLTRAEIGTAEMAVIGEALRHNHRIIELIVSSVYLPIEKLKGLEDEHGDVTEYMDLRHNSMTLNDGVIIGKLLSVNTMLTALDMNTNKLGPEAAPHILQGM